MVRLLCSGWNILTIFGVFMAWNVKLTAAQTDCMIKNPAPQTFSEVDPAGKSLVNLTGGAQANWTIQIKRPANQNLSAYFRLEQSGGNATYYLHKTFDLETVHVFLQGQTTLEFEILCSVVGSANPPVKYSWFASVLAVNEFEPTFVNVPAGGFNISEAKRVGETVETLKNYVVDKDVALNHPGFDFRLLPYSDAQLDGRQKFSLGNSLTGTLVVQQTLDYEAMKAGAKYYLLKVSVGDRNGKTSTSTIRVNILDADDQAPEFFHSNCSTPCFTYYTARIRDSFKGAITWLSPAPIIARDLDSLNSRVTYRLKQGEPKNFAEFVTINSTTGVISVIKPVAETTVAAFYLIVEAVEDTPLQHSQQTSLILRISGRNSTEATLPPVIIDRPSSGEPAFRTATIVLGVLLGLLLLILVIFIVICSLGSHIRTIPVLPKTIGRLSSEDHPPEVGGSPSSTRRKSRKSVTLAKPSGESRLDFMRSLKRSRPASPTLRSFATTPEERDPDIQHLPVTREIDFDNNGVRGGDAESVDLHPRVSTISDSDTMPYEDRMGLVHDAEGMGEERMGLSNPVYDMEEKEEEEEEDKASSVVPPEPPFDAPLYI